MRINPTYIFFLIFTVASSIYGQNSGEQIRAYLQNVPVYDICSDGENIWFATNGYGIFKYSPGKNKWENYSTNNKKLKIDFFYCITANKNFVWAGSTDGLFIFNKKRKRWKRRKFGKGGQLGNWIRTVKFDKFNNVVWIGRFQYLTMYDIKKRKYRDFDLKINGNEKTNNIRSILVEGDSILWIGTEGGLHKIRKKKFMKLDSTKTFYDNSMNYFNGEGDEVSVSAILAERNYLWLGTDEFITPQNPNFNLGGLFRFDKQHDWIKLDASNGLQANGIFSLELTGNTLWASTYEFDQSKKEASGRGITLINRIDLSTKNVVNENLPDNIFKIFYDGKYVWLGTASGVFQIPMTNKIVPRFD